MLVWLGFFAWALCWQVQSGAWNSDFGGHADEAAHVVTGLMVRDYLAGGFLEQWHPMRYAEAYYERFPKVAIGHYPPGFYVVEALFLLPYRQPGAVLVMMVCLAATVGWQTWRMAREFGLGEVGSVLIGTLVIWLPLVRTYTAIVMSDLLLVILILESTRAFGRFLATERWRDSWAFGMLAALAILTKGSGLLLALVPPLAIVFSGRWQLLRSARLWVAPIPVLVLAFPWMLATRHITEEGMSTIPFVEYLPNAVAFYFHGFGSEIGWAVAFLLPVSAAFRLSRRRGDPGGQAKIRSAEAALWSLAASLILFYLAVPSGLDTRYLLPLLPAILVLSVVGVSQLLPVRWRLWGVFPLVVVILTETHRAVDKHYTGAGEVLMRVAQDVELAPDLDEKVLVVSDSLGEGAITAEAAFLGKGEAIEIRRGTKSLAKSDWLGRDYEARFASLPELIAKLRQDSIRHVVVEAPPTHGRLSIPPHWSLSATWLEDASSAKVETGVVKLGSVVSERKFGKTSEFLIYRVATGS